MKFLRRSLFGLFLLSSCAGLVFAAGYRMYTAVQTRAAQDGFKPPARERQFAVNVVTVDVAEIAPELSTFGEVLARRTLELRAPQGGEIIELASAFEDGGTVKAGEVLLRVDPTDALANVRVAQADLQEAEAELSDALRGLEIAQDDLAAARAQLVLRTAALTRQRDLAERGVGTASLVEAVALSEAVAQQSVLSKRQSLATAKARVDQSKNGVLRSEINLSEAQRSLEETAVVAAFDGALSGVSVALGALITANEQIGSLIDPNDLEVAFRVSTQQYSHLTSAENGLPKLPITASLRLADLDLTTRGHVIRESATVGAGQTGRLLFARLDTSLGLRPGDFVTVRIQEPMLSDVARLPAAAVDGANTVLAVMDDNRLETLPVSVLRRVGDDVIVDATGIAERIIVAERSPLLGSGIRVRIIGADDLSDAPTARVLSPKTLKSSGQVQTIELTDAHRAKLLAFVQNNTRMPADVRSRMVEQLQAKEVSADLIARLESRMGS